MPKIPPGKVVVVYGRKTRPGIGSPGYRVVMEGNWSSMPIIEAHAFLNTHERKLDLSMDDVITIKEGKMSKVKVKAAATVQVSMNNMTVKAAAEHLLHKTDEEIDSIARNLLEGTVRTYIHDKGFYSVEQNIAMSQRAMQEMATGDLMSIGVDIISLAIQDIK